MTHFNEETYLTKEVLQNWNCYETKLENSKKKTMSLTEPKCNVLELFQRPAGEELSANQF